MILFIRNGSFQDKFIPVVAPERKYHVKEVRAHSGTELGTWIGWAAQLINIFDLGHS